MENIKITLYAIFAGVRHAVCGTFTVYQLDRAQLLAQNKLVTKPESILAKRRAAAQVSKTVVPQEQEPRIVRGIINCCMLNGGIFWASILLFEYLVLPGLDAITHYLFGSSSSAAVSIWSWTKPILSYAFSTIWVLPLFLISKVVNSLWCQDIANCAYKHTGGRIRPLPTFSKLVADTLFSVLIQALFLVQGMLVSLLPIAVIGELVSLLHMCLLYSLYAFEYKWYNMGWELHKRLSFIENNWPYFFGFGLPLAVLTAIPSSYIISGCVFAILFPFFIISGNEAEPVTGSCSYPLQLFSPVVCLSNAIFNRTMGAGSSSVKGSNGTPVTATPTRHGRYNMR